MARPLVTEELWSHIEPLLPKLKARPFQHHGRNRLDERLALTGILFVLKFAIPWNDLPLELGCGSGRSCLRRLHEWQEAGVWFALHQMLLRELDAAGRIDWSRAAVDGSFARAFAGAGGSGPNPTDRGRPGVKQHILVDGNGIPLAVDSTPANTNEITELLPLVESAGPLDADGEPKHRPKALYADRAYDSEPHRQALRQRGIVPHLAKRNTGHGSGLGVNRWMVERTISRLHGFRKLKLVTEKTLEMQFAFLNLAASLICMRFL